MPEAKKLADSFNDSQTLPTVALKVNQLAASENSTMKDFEEVIKHDPVLVARLLRLVNSAYFGVADKITSIKRAVAFVGIKTIRNLVAVEAMKDFFRKDDEQGFSRMNLWFHSATVAILGQMISMRIFGKKGDDVFMAGILHDVGMIAEDQLAGDQLRQAAKLYKAGDRSLISCEQEIIGTDHCEVGAMLAERWNISPEIIDAIGNHHNETRPYPESSVTGIIQIAEYFAGTMDYSIIPGRTAPLPSAELEEHVQERMNGYRLILSDLTAEMVKAKELYSLDK